MLVKRTPIYFVCSAALLVCGCNSSTSPTRPAEPPAPSIKEVAKEAQTQPPIEPSTQAQATTTNVSFEPIETPLVITKERWKKSTLERAKDGVKSVPWYLKYNPVLGLSASTAAAAYEAAFGGETEDFQVSLGTLLVSPTVIADQISSTARFTRWHGSVPVTIQPDWDSLEELADETSQILFEFRITSESGDSVVQITDVLPNNMIADQNYGADAQVKVGLSSGGKWGPNESEASAGTTFWWKWDPKTVVVASGASGNKAFVLLRRKPDQTGWFGRLPIELALLAPKELTDAQLTITPVIVFSETQKVDLQSCVANILFEKTTP